MKRILVGVDGSPASLKAVELAADLVKKCNAQLSLLTVVSRSPPAVDAGYEEYARIEVIVTGETITIQDHSIVD